LKLRAHQIRASSITYHLHPVQSSPKSVVIVDQLRDQQTSMDTPAAFDPKLLSRSNDICGDSNFTQGCQFSPDGLCILTCTASDNLLRLYNTPTPQDQTQQHEPDVNHVDSHAWKTILSAKGGDSVRSYSWYPLMNSYQPASCAFIASCR